MTSGKRRTDLSVLLLHNVDPCWEASEIEAAIGAVEKMKSALRREGHSVIDVPVDTSDLIGTLKPFSPNAYIVFNWCEELPGVSRSDVTVTQVLEQLRFAYTGSPPQVLSFSWDKPGVKTLLAENKVPTPRWQLFSAPESDGWSCFPAIVKPAFEHCSNGITTRAVVLNARELTARIAFVREEFKQPAIVEDFIDGREFHVTLWGNGTVEMLPVAEMDFTAFDDLRDRLCTFDSKFTPGSLHYEKIELRIPALLEESQIRTLKRIALRAYRILGCRDYARIDLRLRNGIFYVLDVNPNADLSPETSTVYAAQAAGLTYGGIGSRLIGFAARRHPSAGSRKHPVP